MVQGLPPLDTHWMMLVHLIGFKCFCSNKKSGAVRLRCLSAPREAVLHRCQIRPGRPTGGRSSTEQALRSAPLSVGPWWDRERE